MSWGVASESLPKNESIAETAGLPVPRLPALTWSTAELGPDFCTTSKGVF